MYTLGLLACDFVPEDLRDRFDDYPAMFEQAMASADVDVQWRVFRLYDGELPRDIDECDGYITTGARASTYDNEPWIRLGEEFIRRLAASDKRLVGICFGHQLIAQALGGRVENSARGWGIGVREYDTVEPGGWMTPAHERFSVPVCHQDQVVALPHGAQRLATSAHCENFMVQFNETMIGFQGHPEFSTDYIAVLLDLRQAIIGGEIRQTALASLTETGHNADVMRWIATFLGVPR